MESATEASVKPRVLVRVSRGVVDIHSDTELDLVVVDTDLEVKAENVYHLCSPKELISLICRFQAYRFERFFEASLDNPE